MTRCPNTWLGRHLFEAIYDEVPHDFAEKLMARLYQNIEREDSIRRVYVQSVCRHCGAVVDRMEGAR